MPVPRSQTHSFLADNVTPLSVNLVSQAVLLLKPNIILFSTDASPCNAGPMYPDAPASLEGESHVERTCDCLTQSLGCYGCGSTIGCKPLPTTSYRRVDRVKRSDRFSSSQITS